MQKSKKATIITILILLIYGLLATFKFSKDFNILYLYIVNPLFWIAIAVSLHFILGKSVEKRKLKKQIIQYTFVAVLTYIIIYMLSGLVVTFGHNPYSTTLKGILTNLLIFGVALIAKEYIRFKLIDNVYEKDKTFISILIALVYTIIDIEFSRFIGKRVSVIIIAQYFFQTGLPSLVKNLVFSYTARHCSYLPAITYELLTKLYFWISPILPNAPWVMTAIIDTVIPVMLFLYIRYVKNKLDIFRTKENIINSDPKNIIPLIVVIILSIWFAVGVFPIKPVAIASGSMEKELFVGDVVIIKKCTPNDINVGDIIEYQMEGYTVIHRVESKNQRNGEFYFITKGDNNSAPDHEEVREDQLIGKVVFKIRYLGYPAIWLHLIQEQEAMVEVET